MDAIEALKLGLLNSIGLLKDSGSCAGTIETIGEELIFTGFINDLRHYGHVSLEQISKPGERLILKVWIIFDMEMNVNCVGNLSVST